jgi:hypothetical protein
MCCLFIYKLVKTFCMFQCFHTLLRENSVCFAYDMFLNMATMFLTDSKGQLIYIKSEDSKYSYIAAFGVSIFCPDVLGRYL